MLHLNTFIHTSTFSFNIHFCELFRSIECIFKLFCELSSLQQVVSVAFAEHLNRLWVDGKTTLSENWADDISKWYMYVSCVKVKGM